MTIVLLGMSLILSVILYTMINTWYIKPYKDLQVSKRIDNIEHERILASKNELINTLSMQIESLKAKLKSKNKTSKKKILEKFPIKK